MQKDAARATVITGASSGIGAATARLLAAPGESLLLHARGGPDGSRRVLLEEVAESARKAGAHVVAITSDLSVQGNATAVVHACLQEFGRLDRIVSNAGYALSKPLGTLKREDIDDAYSVITAAFFELLDAALPALRRSTCSRVVAVTSFAVDQMPGERTYPATSAAKGALQALAMSFAAQLANDGITVNCVSPGFTAKDSVAHTAMSASAWQAAAAMTPSRRLAEPIDIAHAIEFLLSEKAAHITGQTLRVDGGLSLI